MEIETGKSDAVSNIKKDLNEGFDNVVYVATSEAVAKNIRELIIKTGIEHDTRLRIRNVKKNSIRLNENRAWRFTP